MTELLIQGCSQRKNDPNKPVPPEQLYDGYFFRILEANRSESGRNIEVVVLSAKHGFVTQEDRITKYDTQMTQNRATELNSDIVQSFNEYVRDSDFSDVWVNVGQPYLRALDGIESGIQAEFHYLQGRLGERGHHLKRLLQGDHETVKDELSHID
ncbi:DUF6884 domain-containing protein [Halobaculum halobium]|uniref:DUF6884 domain-containing protein n=1 Tax=Halobaculum halobium TaxID=3032281 RepID=A0ABD5TCW8_9EURY|nr:DUF6884 domain-containing protein [Halobaculum sp. SYNS20]